MSDSNSGIAGRASRAAFVDLARAAAVLLMVANHTGWWWRGDWDQPAQAALTSLTAKLAAPIFMLLAGFSFVLSRSSALSRGLSPEAWARKAVLRGLALLPAGYLLNLAIFPDYPLHLMGPVQTVGLNALLLPPILSRLESRRGKLILLSAAVAAYAAFVLGFAALKGLVGARPWVGQAFFYDVPPWPYSSFVWLGALLGLEWTARKEGEERRRFLRSLGLAGALCVAAGLIGRISISGGAELWLDIGDGWRTAFLGPIDLLWVCGATLVLLPMSDWAARRPLPLGWLSTIGRHALFLYILHEFIVVRGVSKTLGWATESWPVFALANAALVAVLAASARGWEALRRRAG